MHKLIKGICICFFSLFLLFGVYYVFQFFSEKHGKKILIEEVEKEKNTIQKINGRNVIYDCYGVRDAVKLYYTESLLTDTPITSGSVTSLSVSGRKPISGTWLVDDSGVIILTDVLFDDYVCFTEVTTCKCKKVKK